MLARTCLDPRTAMSITPALRRGMARLPARSRVAGWSVAYHVLV